MSQSSAVSIGHVSQGVAPSSIAGPKSPRQRNLSLSNSAEITKLAPQTSLSGGAKPPSALNEVNGPGSVHVMQRPNGESNRRRSSEV